MSHNVRHALVIEDDKHMRILIKSALKMCGCNDVIEIDNGALFFGGANFTGTELSSIRRNHSDIVFLDWMMPNYDGIACAKLIRCGGVDGLDKNVPIIMITGNDKEGSEGVAIEAGVTKFIMKPVSLKALLAAIMSVTETGSLGNARAPQEKCFLSDESILSAS